MKFKTTGILLALLIVVGVVWYFYPQGQREAVDETPPAPSKADAEKFVLDPKPDAKNVTRLIVERSGKPRCVFERLTVAEGSPSTWRALEPLAVPVMPLDSVVFSFAEMRSRTRFEPGAAGAPSEADAGLMPPAAVVTLVDKDGKEYKVEVGSKVAMSTDTYVRVAGQKTIQIVVRDLLAGLKKDFGEYRDKALATFQANDAVGVDVQAGDKSCRLTRGADATWVLDEPVKAYARRDDVLELARKIGGLRAEDFVADAPPALTPYGLDPPEITATVTTETRRQLPEDPNTSATQPAEPKFETVTQKVGIAIGGYADLKKEKRYAKLVDQPWVVSVKQKDVEGLIPDVAKLRDPQITRVKAADATRIELTADGQTATLEKTNNSWHGSGDLVALEGLAVIDLLQAFEDLAAVDYILEPADLSAYGLTTPRAVVRVTAGGAVEPVTLRVGGPTQSGRQTYVLRDGQPTVFVVSTAQADRLAVPVLSLRSRSIFAADEQNVHQLELTRGPQQQTLEREGGRWKMTDPADVPVDSEAVRALVSDLSHLRARRIVAHGDDAQYGLDKPAVTVQFTVESTPPATAPTTQSASAPATQAASAPATQSVAHVLRAATKDRSVYARFDQDPYVFELDETVFKVLNAELIRRQIFDFPADTVVGVTIVAPGGTLEFAKADGQWKFVPDPYVTLSQKKVDDFVKELVTIRAESYLEYRNADLAKAGLLAAPATITIKLADGRLNTLKLEQERPGALPRLAGWIEQQRTFMMRQADCEKLFHPLDYYIQTEAKEPVPGEEEDPNALPPPGLQPPPGRPRPAPGP